MKTKLKKGQFNEEIAIPRICGQKFSGGVTISPKRKNKKIFNNFLHKI